MKSQAFSVRQVKNLFENTHADNSSFAIFSFAMYSQIKGKRMAEVKMLRHIVLSPSRTTWSEIYCKKRWSFYTCRLHGSNVGQRWKCETCQWLRTVKEIVTSFKINHHWLLEVFVLSGPYFLLAALWACLTLSFAPYWRSSRVNNAMMRWLDSALACE